MGQIDCVKLLLSYNVKIDIEDKTSLTPMQCAEINNQEEIVKILKNHVDNGK